MLSHYFLLANATLLSPSPFQCLLHVDITLLLCFQELDADLYGGGATGWAGGGGGGGGGYSRMTIDVTPGEIIPVTVGAGGQPSVGRAGGGVVVLTWDGRLEHVLPFPEHSGGTCHGFTWSSQPVDALDDHFLWCNGHNPAREP